MRYLTLLLLAQLPGALELAQVASDPSGAEVDATLMQLSLTAGDRSSYSAGDVAAADAAIARIEQAGDEADAIIDGYIGRRYTLPLVSVPQILATWARAIARYKLHGNRLSSESTDPIVRDYKDAVKFLALVADGKFSLGVEDPESQGSGTGGVSIDVGQKVFGRSVLP